MFISVHFWCASARNARVVSAVRVHLVGSADGSVRPRNTFDHPLRRIQYNIYIQCIYVFYFLRNIFMWRACTVRQCAIRYNLLRTYATDTYRLLAIITHNERSTRTKRVYV